MRRWVPSGRFAVDAFEQKWRPHCVTYAEDLNDLRIDSKVVKAEDRRNGVVALTHEAAHPLALSASRPRPFLAWGTRVVLPLFIGTTTYLLRPGGERAFRAVGLGHPLQSIRCELRPVALSFPTLLLSTLPDATWAFAVGGALGLLWRDGGTNRERRTWLILGLLAANGYELAQLVHLTPGTFDPCDLLAILLGYSAAVALSPRPRTPETI